MCDLDFGPLGPKSRPPCAGPCRLASFYIVTFCTHLYIPLPPFLFLLGGIGYSYISYRLWALFFEILDCWIPARTPLAQLSSLEDRTVNRSCYLPSNNCHFQSDSLSHLSVIFSSLFFLFHTCASPIYIYLQARA